MKTIIAVILMTAASLASASNSQAQTVQDDDSGHAYFVNYARELCGSRAHISLSADSASVFLYGEHLENRNLDEVARNLAVEGLNAFPDSPSFYVYVKDSKGSGYAEVRR